MAIDRANKNGEPDIEEVLDDLTSRIERLRVLFEQYFMGIEKLQPGTARAEVARKILELQQQQIRNTGLRYRFNMLVQKFSVYTTYWNRTLRAIEAGTYYRDVARAGRAAVARGKDVPDEVLRALPERMRAKIMKEREQLAARKAKTAALDAAAAGPAVADASDDERTEPRAMPPMPELAEISEDDSDIDSALDNIFGEAEAAVSRPAPAKASAPRPSTPPPMPAPGAGSAARPSTPAPGAGSATRPSTPLPVARAGGPPSPTPTAPPRAGTPTPTAPPRAATPPPRPTPGGGTATLPTGVDERAARDLHKKYVQAKKLLGEETDHIKYEHIVATIAKQAPAIMKQHQAKSVDFEVVIKDDKVILKATPKK